MASLNDIQKALDALNKQFSNLGKNSPFSGKTAKDMVDAFGSAEQAARAIEVSMKGIRAEIVEAASGVSDLRDRFTEINNELKSFGDPYKNAVKSFNKLYSLNEDLADIQFDLAKSSIKETRSLRSKVNLEFQRLRTQSKYLKDQIDSGKLQGKELTRAVELLKFAEDEAQALEEKVGYQSDFNKALDETERRQKNISKATGLTGKILGGFGNLLEKAGFGDLSDDIQMAKDEMGALAVELTDNGNKAAGLSGQFKIMGAGLKSLGKSLMSALADPLVIIGLVVTAIKSLINFMGETNKKVSDTGKLFGIAGDQAKTYYNEIAQASSLYYFPEELLKGQQALNDAAGRNLAFNKENAELAFDLTERLGMSAEEAGRLYVLSGLTGESFKGLDESVTSSLNSLNDATGAGLRLNDVMSDIAKSSASTRFNIRGGVEGISRAAFASRRLGMDMNSVAEASKSLLDFEGSIASEIEAEMFLQKDLNLEKLRYATLTGDAETKANELRRLVKANLPGLKGNVLAQEAFAKSLGISTEEMMNINEEINKEATLGTKAYKAHQANLAAQAETAKQAETFNRQMDNAANQLKVALLPLVQAITPFFISMAEAVGGIAKSLSGETGQTIMKILGYAAAAGGTFYVGKKIIGGIKGMLGGAGSTPGGGPGEGGGGGPLGKVGQMLGLGGKIGSSANNPMYVYVVNQGGGGSGGDLMDMAGDALGRRNVKGLKAFKGLSKVFGGKKTMVGRGLRNVAAMMGKRSSFGSQVMKSVGNKGVMGSISSMFQGGAGAATQAATSTTQAASSSGGFFSKALGSIKNVASKGLGGVKSILGSPIAKGFGKALGPIFALVSGISSVSSLISNAKAQKSQGGKVDTGALGKKIVQASAYPIANASMNLIPGVGTAISIADGILGAFGMSPIKWITDNLVDLVPNNAFEGLGRLALGEPKKMAVGGIVNEATNTIVGEAGPEAVIPLREFYAKIDELITAVKAGGDVYLDGNKVGHSLALANSRIG